MAGCTGSRRFEDDVRIEWRCEGATCRVEVWWRKSLIMPAQLSSARPTAAFSVSDEHDPRRRVEGEFALGPGRDALTLVYLRYPGGAVRDEPLCRPGPPPPPPVPPPHPDPDPVDPIDALAVHADARDLFPYVFLRGWPPTPDAQCEDRFVRYPGVDSCATDDERLFCLLREVDRTGPDARGTMIARALAYIEDPGAATGAFASGPRALPAPLDRFAQAQRHLERAAPQCIDAFVASLCEHLHMDWPALVEATRTVGYAEALDRAWQSLFALCIVLGYDRAGLSGLIRTVVLAALLQRLIASTPPVEDEGEQPLPPAQAWPPLRLQEGLEATVVLPAPVFPLPPAVPVAGLALPWPDAGILPFAIGDLQRVKERLVRYQLGEVGHIENVMAGERKTRRQLERQREDRSSLSSDTAMQDDSDSTQARSDAFEQHAKSVLHEQFKQDYSTTYGPPKEATATGSITLLPNADNVPTRADADDRSALGREITQHAVRRYARQLGTLRRERVRREQEHEVGHVIDRRGLDTGTRGIYRWVNAVHRCWVETVGQRLVLELFVPQPARDVIASALQFAGVPLTRPLPLSEFGVDTFEDIALDADAPAYYAALAARYGVDDIALPPPLLQTRAAVFETDPPLSATLLALPEGYAARSAVAVLGSSDPALAASLSIGGTRVELTIDGSTPPAPIDLAGQCGMLPLAFALALPVPVTSASGEVAPRFTLTVQVDCEATPDLLGRWRSAVYARLQQAYRAQLAAYLDASQMRSAPQTQRNTLAQRKLVRDTLQRRGLQAFVALARRRIGEDARIARFLPALAVWLERVLDWNGMSLSFVDCIGEGQAIALRADGDEAGGLAPFLQADVARVLLPVVPGHEQALLFFLATGMVWDDADMRAPTFETPVETPDAPGTGTRFLDVANAWKTASADPHHPAPVPAPWHVLLPTTLTVLQHGDELPSFE